MSTQNASCLCGNIKVSFVDEPIKRILCHCLDCRKITGAHYSDNGVVEDAQFKLLSGTPKVFHKVADSGKGIDSFFCGECGTTLWREGEWLPGHKIIKVGIVDDPEWQGKHAATGELFENRKIDWLPELIKKDEAEA